MIVIVLDMSYWTVYFQQFSLMLFMKLYVVYLYDTFFSQHWVDGNMDVPHNMVTVAYDLLLCRVQVQNSKLYLVSSYVTHRQYISNLLEWMSLSAIYVFCHTCILFCVIQSVPLATEPGISWIILTPMKILQRNLNRSTFVAWEMKRNVSVVCVCNVHL